MLMPGDDDFPAVPYDELVHQDGDDLIAALDAVAAELRACKRWLTAVAVLLVAAALLLVASLM